MTSTPLNLLDLKPEEFKKFLDSFDYVFSDCDGVLWTQEPLPRVGEFFSHMQKLGKIVHFVSNNSFRTKESYDEMFNKSEIKDGYENLTIPAIAIAEYLKSLNFDKKIYSVSCRQTTTVLESYGIKCKTGPEVPVDMITPEYLEYFEDDPEIGAVVFEADFNTNLTKMHKAITYLKRPDVLFFCGSRDSHFYIKGGAQVLGTAVYTDIVSKESNRSPIVMGKPSKDLGDFVMERVRVKDPSRVLFIGDKTEQDVCFGKESGFQTLLILTYLTEERMLADKIAPEYYADSLASVVPLLEGN